MSPAVERLVAKINEVFRDYGITMSEQESKDEIVVTLHVPAGALGEHADLLLPSRHAIPTDAIGAMVGAKHKLRKKLKKGIKKLAKSKVLKALAHTAAKFSPGGGALLKAVNAGKKVSKLAKHSKHKHPVVRAAANSEANAAHDEIEAAQQDAGGGGGGDDSPETIDAGAPGADPMPQEDTSALLDVSSDDGQTPESANADQEASMADGSMPEADDGEALADDDSSESESDEPE